MNLKKNSSLAIQILIAILLGVLTGKLLGKNAFFLGEISSIFVRILKVLAAPLIFFAIVDAFLKTEIKTRSGIKLIQYSLTNAVMAGCIAVSLSWVFPENIKIPVSLTDSTAQATPFLKNPVEPFLAKNTIPIILIAIIFGIILKSLGIKKSGKFFSNGLHFFSNGMGWVVKVVPLVVWGIISKMIGLNGFDFLFTLGIFLGFVFTGIFLQVFVFYPIILRLKGISPVRFFKNAADPLFTAFGTGSSLATLPVTLKTLQERMKISEESARLAACIGTNLNHTGILLYEAVAALFVANLHGIHLSFQQKLTVLGTSAIAAAGIAGVPDAGLITLSLVLSSVGLPLTLIPVLMTIDWLIGRLRAMTNVASDLVVAHFLDKN